MGIENRFFFRTGVQWVNSSESLACLLVANPSWRDTRAALFWFRVQQTWRQGSSALNFGCISHEKTTIRSLATLVKFPFHQRGNCLQYAETFGHTAIYLQDCRVLIHYYLATQVRQAAAELIRRHLLLMQKVTLNSPGRPGSVYLVNVSTISFCRLLQHE